MKICKLSNLLLIVPMAFLLSINKTYSQQSEFMYCGVYDFHVVEKMNASQYVINSVQTLDNHTLRKNDEQIHENSIVASISNSGFAQKRYYRKTFTLLQPYYKYAALVDVLILKNHECKSWASGQVSRLVLNKNGLLVHRFFEEIGPVISGDQERDYLNNISTSLDEYKNSVVSADSSFKKYSQEVDAAFASVTDRILSISMSDSDRETIRAYVKKVVQEEFKGIIQEEVTKRLKEGGNDE